MRLLQSSFRTLGTMEKENKKLKLKFRTCIEVKPILSTIKVSQKSFTDVNGVCRYEMQFKVEGTMTAYSTDDTDIWVKDNNNPTSVKYADRPTDRKREVSSWLRDAIASGEVEVELVNESTPIEYFDWEAVNKNWSSRYSAEQHRRIQDEATWASQDGNAYNGADGVNFDGEAM